MLIKQKSLTFHTKGRGTCNITADIKQIVMESKVITGICQIFLHHTSASLIFCENADPTVLRDLEVFFQRLVPDGDKLFLHDAEGADDMPAHIRTILTQNVLTIPITDGNLALGTWQGIFLWEHRLAAHQRQITVTTIGIE